MAADDRITQFEQKKLHIPAVRKSIGWSGFAQQSPEGLDLFILLFLLFFAFQLPVPFQYFFSAWAGFKFPCSACATTRSYSSDLLFSRSSSRSVNCSISMSSLSSSDILAQASFRSRAPFPTDAFFLPTFKALEPLLQGILRPIHKGFKTAVSGGSFGSDPHFRERLL